MSEKIDIVLEAELTLLIEQYGCKVVYKAFMYILKRDKAIEVSTRTL